MGRSKQKARAAAAAAESDREMARIRAQETQDAAAGWSAADIKAFSALEQRDNLDQCNHLESALEDDTCLSSAAAITECWRRFMDRSDISHDDGHGFCCVMRILLEASRIPETFGGPDTMPILDALGEKARDRRESEEVGWFAECHHDMLLRVLRVMRARQRQPDVEIVGAPLGIPVPPIEVGRTYTAEAKTEEEEGEEYTVGGEFLEWLKEWVDEADGMGETELQASRVADLGLESERELKEGLRPLLAAAAAAPTASGEPEAEVGNKRPREE